MLPPGNNLGEYSNGQTSSGEGTGSIFGRHHSGWAGATWSFAIRTQLKPYPPTSSPKVASSAVSVRCHTTAVTTPKPDGTSSVEGIICARGPHALSREWRHQRNAYM